MWESANIRKGTLVFILVIIVILTVITTLFMDVRSIINSDKEKPSTGIYWTTSNYWTHDKQFIHAMYEIGRLVPQHEVLLVSLPWMQISYFTHHKILFPKNITSEESLLNFMARNNYSYFLTFNDFESKYNNWLSNVKDHDKLNFDYYSLANYTTDKFNIHLLERNYQRTSKMRKKNIFSYKSIYDHLITPRRIDIAFAFFIVILSVFYYYQISKSGVPIWDATV